MFTIEFLIGAAVWLVVLIFVRRRESALEGVPAPVAFNDGAGVVADDLWLGDINPGTCLPMVEGTGFDVGGDPCGCSGHD